MRILLDTIFSVCAQLKTKEVVDMPIRSPRAVYLIKGMNTNVDDDPNVIDNLPGGIEPKTVRPVYCKMKRSIGNYFGLTPLASDDILFQGTFGGNGLNKGYKFQKNIGGFKEASYKLIPLSTFTINELVLDKNTGTYIVTPKNFRSMSIGFPKGHSVTEFLTWLASLTGSAQVRAIVTPKGRKIER